MAPRTQPKTTRLTNTDHSRGSLRRIVFVFYADVGAPYGKGIASLKTAAGFLEGEWEVTLVARGNPQGLPHVRTAIPLGNLLPRALVAGERWIAPSFESRLAGERIFDRCASRLITGEPGLLYSVPRMAQTLGRARQHGWTTVLHGAEAHPRANAAILESERKRWGVENSHPGWSARLLQLYEESLEAADYLVALSEFSAGTYAERGFPSSRVFVNPSGVDLETFTPVDRSSTKTTFLFVGNMSLLKGVQYLWDAWQKADLTEARLLMCGDVGRDLAEIKGSLADRTPNIHFLGERSPLELYRSADVFVFPSLSEGMAKVTLEAMAAGLPVITTPNSGSVVRDGLDGILVPPADEESLAEAMRTLDKDPVLRRRMGDQARMRASAFTWERYSREVATIAENILER